MIRTAVTVLALCAATVAQAQPLFGLPFADVAPHVEGERVVTAAVGLPGGSRRLDAGRLSARRAAERRARNALHTWLDEQLAREQASPVRAAAAHAALDRDAVVDGVRPLTDGAAVVVLSCPVRSFALTPPRG